MRYHLSMVRLDLDESGGEMQCEGCGTPLPAFLDGCPYCAGKDLSDDDVLPCPLCGVEIYQNAQQCPSCGGWVTPQVVSPRQGVKTAVVVLVVALVILAFWLRGV